MPECPANKTKSYVLDIETIKKLETMAQQSDRSLSYMVRVCINERFEREISVSEVSQEQHTVI